MYLKFKAPHSPILSIYQIMVLLTIAIEPHSSDIQKINNNRCSLSRKRILIGPDNPSSRLRRLKTAGVGGISVGVHTYPFIISLRENDRYICGGVILSPDKIITTAHCFKHRLSLGLYTVHASRSKKYGLEDVEQVFKIIKILIHPGYDRATYDSDIVIVKLNASIKLSAMAKVADLPKFNQVLPPDSYCCMVGFGETLGYGNPNLLNEGCFPNWSQEKCNNRDYYDGRISSNMICAGEDSGGIDACRGDSGGPLYCTVGDGKIVWGLVSWGIGCAEANKPGVYVNLAKYINWIEQNSEI